MLRFSHILPPVSEKPQEVSKNESDGNCAAGGRSGAHRDPEGDPTHHAYPGRRPITDNIDKPAEILLRHVGFSQTAGVEVVHSDEKGCTDRANPEGRIWHETDNIISAI